MDSELKHGHSYFKKKTSQNSSAQDFFVSAALSTKRGESCLRVLIMYIRTYAGYLYAWSVC